MTTLLLLEPYGTLGLTNTVEALVITYSLVPYSSGNHDLWCVLQNRAVDASADASKHHLPHMVEAVRKELHGANERIFAAKLDTAKYMRAIWDLHNA